MVVHRVRVAVYAALLRADIVRYRHRCGYLYLGDARAEVNAAYLDELLHHLICKTALEVVILLFLHAQERLDRDKVRDRQVRVALRDAVGHGIVEAGCCEEIIRLGEILVIAPYLVGVHRFTGEGVVIGNAVFLRRSFENEHDGHRADVEAIAVDKLYRAFRYFAERLDHLSIHAVGVGAADDIVTGDLVSALRAHAAYLSVTDKDLYDLLIEFKLRSVLLYLLLHTHAHLMRAVTRHIASREVVRHAVGVYREWQVVHRLADVYPVRRKDIHSLLRELEGLDDLGGTVSRNADEVQMLSEHFKFAHRRDGDHIHAVIDAAAELQKLPRFKLLPFYEFSYQDWVRQPCRTQSLHTYIPVNLLKSFRLQAALEAENLLAKF